VIVVFRSFFSLDLGHKSINLIEECVRKGIPIPEYKYEFTTFQTVFFKNGTVNGTVNDVSYSSENSDDKQVAGREKAIISFIQRNPNVTVKELSELCKVSIRTLNRDIDKLKKVGAIRRVGSDKTGKWKINVKYK
jgi:predicted HTH transcriptional regulator